MTIENVIQGIIDAIHERFTTKKIYTEPVSQMLETSSFFVKCLNPAQNIDYWKRYKKNHQFSVQYIPAEADLYSYAECNAIADELFDCLANISVSNKVLHGSNLQSQITDGVLTFTVDYNIFVMKGVTPEISMEDVDITMNSKE